MTDHDIASRALLLANLPETLRRALLARASPVDLAAGDTLFREGETATAAYVVVKGMVKLSTDSSDGVEAVIGLYEAGESLAEALALTGEAFPVDAVALRPARVLSVPHTAIRDTLLADPDAMVGLLAATFRHLHQLLWQVRSLKTRHGTERLALFLLEQAEKVGEPVFSLPCEKVVLAGYLGMTPESLSRSLRMLREHGASVDGTIVSMTDPEALRRFLSRAG